MSFANFAREISDEIHQMEGHLEIAEFEIAFENFSPLRNFNLGRPPMRIRPQKKEKEISLYFSTTFSQPSKVVCFLTLASFRARLWALTSFRAHLRALDHSFKCAFEPSPPFECTFESSLPSSAPSSPWPSFWVRLRALIFLSLFTWVGHPSRGDPFFFYLGRSPIIIRPFPFFS